MKKRLYRTARMVLFCCLAAALPAFAQDNHARQNDQSEHNQTQRNDHQAQRPNPQTPNTRPNRDNNHAQQPNRGNYHPQQPNRSARPSPNRAQQRRPNHGRPAQWGRPPSHRGSYSFRSNDRARLHSYYMARLRAINRANRPIFRVGGYFPYADIGYLSPLPPDLYGTLPPPPYGYQMGYYDGYVVVYDPMTYFIASVIDLLQ